MDTVPTDKICARLAGYRAGFGAVPPPALVSFAELTGCSSRRNGASQWLVFSKTAAEKGLVISFTEDATQFAELKLKKYHTVVFLNTTGGVLNNEQQSAFERYIQAGGGYVGIHAATGTEIKAVNIHRLYRIDRFGSVFT